MKAAHILVVMTCSAHKPGASPRAACLHRIPVAVCTLRPTCQQKAPCKVSLVSYKAFLNLKGIYKPSSLPLATLAQMDNEHVDLLKMILWSLSIQWWV